MKRSKFSLSHYKLLTMDMGKLIPLTWYEALPSDSFQHQTSCLIRVSPLLSPVMHPVRVRLHHFFVPYRIIWDDFEDFITGGDDGEDDSVHPYIETATINEGDLQDYMGIPPGTHGLAYNALPFRAYAKIWNEYYRDPDLGTELVIDTTSGEDSTTELDIQSVCWEKDYFTTARLTQQKGDDLYIPLGSQAPVKGIGKGSQNYGQTNQNVYETDGSSTRQYASAQLIHNGADEAFYVEQDPSNSGYPNIYADLSEATGISVNDLREYLARQRMMEARSRYGNKYEDYLRYMGVRPQDARLGNPEFLAGGSNVIQFSEVLRTGSDSVGSDVIGEMKGHGIAAIRSNRFRRFIPEHGLVMTLMSVVPKAIYTTTFTKPWFRETKEDYFQKELQFLGDEEVYNKEIEVDHATPEGTFGFQQKYDSYRYLPSTIAGEFRSTLNYWHYGREFAADPSLNEAFVTATPTKRVNASTDTDCLYVMAQHSIQARRQIKRAPMPRTF